MKEKSMATRLKTLILDDDVLLMPGAFDAISSAIVEAAGFKAIQASGANVVAAHFGVPDYSLVSAREMAHFTGQMVRSVNIPVMGDADTGFGNAANAWLATKEFERQGAAGINIEDQVEPKRCGHLEGKSLISLEEAAAKVSAVADARKNPDFVINARTDALSVYGIEEVIRRGNAYMDAGATMIFVEGVNSVEAIQEAVAGINGPVGINMVEGGKTPPDLTFDMVQKLGVARVSLPSTLMQASIKAMQTVLEEMKNASGITGYEDKLCGFGVSQRMLGRDHIFELEERFMGPLAKND